MPGSTTPTERLCRLQSRRATGTPTISTLVGPTTLALSAWSEFCKIDHRPIVVSTHVEPAEILTQWQAAWDAVTPLRTQAVNYLAAKLGQPADSLAADFAKMTEYDFAVYRQTVRVPANDLSFAFALSHCGPTPRVSPSPDFEKTIAPLADLYPPNTWPALLLTVPPDAPPGWIAKTVHLLERWTTFAPRLPIGIALSASEANAIYTSEPNSRITAMLQEGTVEVVGVPRETLDAKLAAEELVVPAPVLDALVARGVTPQLAESLVAVTRAVQKPTTPREDGFRSEPERFLFELLETMPQTLGLFRPNQPMSFHHGNKPAEADLLCERWKLVIEIDGIYFHLNPEQYRRDRTKDRLYQQHGYFVLRFLAEDLAIDSETILPTILSVLHHQQHRLTPE